MATILSYCCSQNINFSTFFTTDIIILKSLRAYGGFMDHRSNWNEPLDALVLVVMFDASRHVDDPLMRSWLIIQHLLNFFIVRSRISLPNCALLSLMDGLWINNKFFKNDSSDLEKWTILPTNPNRVNCTLHMVWYMYTLLGAWLWMRIKWLFRKCVDIRES